MRGTPAEGRVKAKTGTLSNVRALSGYLTTLDDDTVVFSILANNFRVSGAEIDGIMEAAVNRVVQWFFPKASKAKKASKRVRRGRRRRRWPRGCNRTSETRPSGKRESRPLVGERPGSHHTTALSRANDLGR
jgi:D-alanyl-D-alanine carboxypeptidase/D-alanyl-D-alanine-endopeptidase (penicillin-binding protein 4)